MVFSAWVLLTTLTVHVNSLDNEPIPNFLHTATFQYRTWPMPKIRGLMGKPLKKWLKKPSFEALGGNKLTLVPYSEIIRDFGWGCLKEVGDVCYVVC